MSESTTPNPLEIELLRELQEINRVLKKDHKYVPKLFNQMVGQYGPVGAIKRLLAAEIHQEGFSTLLSFNRLDLSIENVVQNPKWAPLFTPEERKKARERLTKMEFTPTYG